MTCHSLLPKTSTKHILSTVLSVIVFILLISFVIQIQIRKAHKTTCGAIIVSLNFSNIFCLIYLSFIKTADIIYHTNYIVNDFTWRSSPACFAVFNIFLYYSSLNPALHLILSTSRVMVVFFPVKTKFKNYNFILKCLFYIFITLLLVAFSSTFVVRATSSALPFKLCFPFIDPTSFKNILLNKVTWLISLSQLASLLTVYIQHTLLLVHFQHSKQSLQKTCSETLIKTTLVKQVITETVSIALHWLPTSIMYITMLLHPKYPSDLMFWTALVIVPATSHLHPCVVIITNLRNIIRHYRSGS